MNDSLPARDRRHGATPKLTRRLIRQLTDIIAEGNYNVVAYQKCGVSESSFYNWRKWGREDVESNGGKATTRYGEFYLELIKAEAEAESYAVETVKAAMAESWQAAMTFLERKYPDRWGRRQQITSDVTVRDDSETRRILAGLSFEERLEMMTMIDRVVDEEDGQPKLIGSGQTPSTERNPSTFGPSDIDLSQASYPPHHPLWVDPEEEDE